MIRYTLKCSQNHVFESWFASAEAYETLKASGHVACAICGDGHVEKALMAPAVAPKGANDAAPSAAEPPVPALAEQTSPQEMALQQLKAHLEANSDYVGRDFATTARAMHDGEEPGRSIHGEASIAEAKGLLEDGIPVAPIPFTTQRKTN